MEEKLPKRKYVRLKSHNYDVPGAYFITVCTQDREQTLSAVGAIHESPAITLKEYGAILEDVIRDIPEHFGVIVDKYVIMPDHVHFILVITRENAERAIRESPLRNRSIISNAVGYVKMMSSKRIHSKCNNHDVIWQRSYYEHIIRDKNDYEKIVEYIHNNPLKWQHKQ